MAAAEPLKHSWTLQRYARFIPNTNADGTHGREEPSGEKKTAQNVSGKWKVSTVIIG